MYTTNPRTTEEPTDRGEISNGGIGEGIIDKTVEHMDLLELSVRHDKSRKARVNASRIILKSLRGQT